MPRFLLLLILAALSQIFCSTEAATQRPQAPLVVSLQDSLNKWATRKWSTATEMVQREQAVEDDNGDYVARSPNQAQASRRRRLIALPLTDAFDPPMGVFSHGHVQTGDKMSLPANFWNAIQWNKAEVPWLVSVSRIPPTTTTTTTSSSSSTTEEDPALVTPPRVQFCDNNDNDEDPPICPHIPARPDLTTVVGGPLDFRAPPGYVFLPLWMMRALGLRPGEVVQVELVETVAAGRLAKLRPHSEQFAKTIANPQAVLETELRHYSSLTKGSTIAMDYNRQRYWFDVVDCKSTTSKGGEASVPFVKVQDCDIATDFLPSREHQRDMMRKKRRRQKELEQED